MRYAVYDAGHCKGGTIGSIWEQRESVGVACSRSKWVHITHRVTGVFGDGPNPGLYERGSYRLMGGSGAAVVDLAPDDFDLAILEGRFGVHEDVIDFVDASSDVVCTTPAAGWWRRLTAGLGAAAP